MQEKRASDRVNISFEAELRALGDLDWRRGSVADIGETGVRIRTASGHDLLPGTGVWVRIQPREMAAKLVVRGSVVRCAALEGHGVEVACEFA